MKKRSAKQAAKPASSAPGLDLEQLRALVGLMRDAELSVLEIDDQRAGLRVALRRGAEAPATSMAPMMQVVPGAAAHFGAGASAGPGAPQSTPPEVAAGTPPPGTVEFKSPMVGTFYRSSSPDAEPFVEVGSRVDEDSTLCIVEAMKVMNEIKAEMRGVVAAVLVQNGEPIEFGQPLFLVKPA